MEFQPGDSWKSLQQSPGHIQGNVSGLSYWDYMHQRVFRPLGMNATTNRLGDHRHPNRASGYEQTNHVWVNRDSI